MAAIWWPLNLVLILSPCICHCSESGHELRLDDQEDYQNGGFASMAPNQPATVSVRLATVTSPGYPGNYPPNLTNVLLSIGVPWDETEGYVSLHFIKFDVQTCSFCTCDFLHIDAIHMFLCGDSLPPYFKDNTIIVSREKIQNNLITFNFTSNAEEEHSGFAIRYELHTHRPSHTHPAHGPYTTHRPVSTRHDDGHSTHTTRPVATNFAHDYSTTLSSVSRCPVAHCPTCRPGERHATMTLKSCPTCMCVATPFPTPPPTSACPVANCLTCFPGMKHTLIYETGCPRCTCFTSTTSSSHVTSGDSRLLQLLRGIAHDADIIQSEAQHLQDELLIAKEELMHRVGKNAQDTMEMDDGVVDDKRV